MLYCDIIIWGSKNLVCYMLSCLSIHVLEYLWRRYAIGKVIVNLDLVSTYKDLGVTWSYFCPIFLSFGSEQKDYILKRHRLKCLWRPEITQLKGLSACGIKAGVRKLQTVGEVEKYHLCPSLSTKPNWGPLLSSSPLWGLLNGELKPILWFLWWFPDMVYSLLCRFNGAFN